ncbi:putative ABC transport system permease protein [Micromonospora coriariae]|uniref:Putative ABC transport system permease protein n=1 Tax=Micromonospora coriariae TaxID=285665 RepID=A0A1C4V1I5_9ACTN|nr:ABC transporter permease [Micromonospora coriariae]SCE77930.1 putative ABC transport system permease protein [Micromonospora coriariae]
MLSVRRSASAFVAVAIGVALVAAATLLLASGRPQVPERLAQAAVVVQSPEAGTAADSFVPSRPWSATAAAELTSRLAGLPGVAAAVPDRTFYAQPLVGGRPSAADARREDAHQGHGWSDAQLGGLRRTAGEPPRKAGEVVVDSALGLRTGAPVTLLTAAGPQPYTVSGLVDAPGVYVADEVAAELAPGVRAIGLLLAPGADPERVAVAARGVVGGDGQVLTGDARGALEPRGDARTRWIGTQVLTATAALAGFVTVFVVASTFAFTIAQRRRELGLLRAVGATPHQVRRMVYAEALAVGASAGLVGLLVGAALAPALGRLLVDVGFEPATFAVRYAFWPVAVSLVAGPVIALLAVWSASRRAARVRPLEALREAAVEQRPIGRLRVATGAFLVAVGAALSVGTATADEARVAAQYALYAVMALVAGATVLAPAVVGPVVRLLRSPVRRPGGAIGMLVRGGALTATRRTASLAAPVLLTVAFAVLVSGMVRTTTAAYAAGRADNVNAGWIVVPDGGPGLSDQAVATAGGTALLPTTVFRTDPGTLPENRPLTALGVDPAGFTAANRALTVVAGSLNDLRGDDTVVLTASEVPAAGLPSQPYPVVFADGTLVPLRVVAVVTDDSLPGDLLVPRAVVRRHDPSALTSTVYVRDRIDPPVGARIVDVATWAAEADAAEDRLVWLFTLLLIGVSAGYGAIAVANTLLLAAAGRAADLRLIRLAGATRRQVIWLVTAESALVVLIGALLGGAVAFAGLLSIRAGLAEQVGAPVDLVVPWPVVGGVVGLCLLLAVVASALPAWRLLHHRPARSPVRAFAG